MMAPTVTFDYKGTYDENWSLPASLTLEQYSHVIFRPDAHFVDGRIVPRALGDRTHSRMVAEIRQASFIRSMKPHIIYLAVAAFACVYRRRVSASATL